MLGQVREIALRSWLGELTARRAMENGMMSSVKFQGAEVRKPLLAVSGLNDKGNPVWFDHDTTGVVLHHSWK